MNLDKRLKISTESSVLRQSFFFFYGDFALARRLLQQCLGGEKGQRDYLF